jgi:hypothetical protein
LFFYAILKAFGKDFCKVILNEKSRVKFGRLQGTSVIAENELPNEFFSDLCAVLI